MKQTVLRCLKREPDREELRTVIDRCHSMALAYLRMKAASRQLYMIRNERLEDLAWDFIADLFEKDDENMLSTFCQYFNEESLVQMDETDVQSELRKLVFTKVDDNIFRAVGEKDPSLRKIIRNLKLAIRDRECEMCVCYRDGMICVDTKSDPHLHPMPSEFLQMKLCKRLDDRKQIPDILTEVIDILLDQSEYRKEISLVKLAKIIRETFVHIHGVEDHDITFPKAAHEILNGEFESFLEKSAKRIISENGTKYIDKGKLTERELYFYIYAAKDIVRDHFINGKTEYSQFEYLKQHMPELEYEEFRSQNRQVVEYLVKLIRSDLVQRFKNDWQ